MGGRGSVFARCGCRDGQGGRRGASCPRLGEAGHGSWYFSAELPRHIDGGRRRLRRGGYLTCEAADAARNRLSVPVLGDRRDGVYTVAEWLETWVETRARLRDTSRRAYRGHIRLHLRRLLDGVLLRELHIGHVQDAFRRLFSEGMTAATARRLLSTLRSGLNAAVRERLIPDNPSRYLKLPKGRRPFAVVWTKRRVQEWRRTGERPVVAVWTPAQLAEFLSSVAGHPLFPVYRLVAMRGLRRGEACGLRWDDLDLDEGIAYISRQLQQDAVGRLRACPLKTESSRRAVALDPETVIVLRAHRSRQERQFSQAGVPPQGWVFTHEDGQPLSPDYLTRTFSDLVEEAGLPPVRLHDLRHGAATLMLLAGAELKTIADQLGHSSVVLTADTYLSVAVELGLKAAAAAARLVLEAGRSPPGGGTTRRRSAPTLAEITA
ncbi:MAG: tyrosine-type recombinase/integrase [Trebonia sp.]